ncbi:MAG: hypothetical protein R3F05_19285 [Planctomycetota bacterium]
MLASVDDAALLRQLETLALPLDQWTHRAHVRLGHLYVVAHGFDQHPELHTKQVLRPFHSRGRMMKAGPQATFVEPDRVPVPRSAR